jgi:hypothetical protein
MRFHKWNFFLILVFCLHLHFNFPSQRLLSIYLFLYFTSDQFTSLTLMLCDSVYILKLFQNHLSLKSFTSLSFLYTFITPVNFIIQIPLIMHITSTFITTFTTPIPLLTYTTLITLIPFISLVILKTLLTVITLSPLIPLLTMPTFIITLLTYTTLRLLAWW